MNYGGYFDIDKKKKEVIVREKRVQEPDFWNNQRDAQNYINELNKDKNIINTIELLKKNINDNIELLELILVDYDEELKLNLEKELDSVSQEIVKIDKLLLLSGPYDNNNCILEIHSGAGGTEACDWANMLFRMYTRFCEKNNYKYELLSILDGDEAGIKSVTLKISGSYAYGNLKSEKGVHRLVRLSPFDANNKRHTSFASVDVMPEFNEDINITIDEKDLKIDVYRSSGAGGQHVNTTDSAVRITHLPTKIVVTCQNERSQIQNRETAMKLLKGKLKLLEMEKQHQELQSIKGENVNIEFGSQIRSYVMHPYSMVKDHRTNYETSDVNGVLDGNINDFINAYLNYSINK